MDSQNITSEQLEKYYSELFIKVKAELKYLRHTQKHLRYGKKAGFIQTNLNGKTETIELSEHELNRLKELNLWDQIKKPEL